ncbi:hypothetical protein AcV5_004994 [Taiwanofungus camphoratus]|nr:hypothetical protein AcV5_004994 [Antrodia cinnamomea]
MSVAGNSRPLSTAEGFICGGIAACVAVTISNPAEVAKTRLQLQGELAKDGGVRVYKNTLDVVTKTFQNEGIRGVQRGLGPAYIYQILLNGSRLGFYEPFRRTCNSLLGYSPSEQRPMTSVLAGAVSGAVGASLGNPLFLIKARMQAYSPALPVGAQRHYKSSFDALITIYRAENFRGLIRGIDAAILRTTMGSSVRPDMPVYARRFSSLLPRSNCLPITGQRTSSFSVGFFQRTVFGHFWRAVQFQACVFLL